eukprot:1654721-Rhodomonas_salina.2
MVATRTTWRADVLTHVNAAAVDEAAGHGRHPHDRYHPLARAFSLPQTVGQRAIDACSHVTVAAHAGGGEPEVKAPAFDAPNPVSQPHAVQFCHGCTCADEQHGGVCTSWRSRAQLPTCNSTPPKCTRSRNS